MPTEVTSVISPDTILPLALVSAICSAIALIVNAVIPFFTQYMTNRHTLKMANIELWNKAKFEAFQALVAGSEILVYSGYTLSLDVRKKACASISKVMPFLATVEIETATRLIKSIESVDLGTTPEYKYILQEYTNLLDVMAKKMEDPAYKRERNRKS